MILKTLYSKPYYSAMFFALATSLSPVINANFRSGSYLLIALIILMLSIHLVKDSLIKTKHIVIWALVSVLILLQVLLVSLSGFQIILSIYRFIVIPFVIYYSFIYSKKNNLKFSQLLVPYFIVNLIIVYYRTVIDYSFFGVVNIYSGTEFEHLFAYGGQSFRPSNLSTPIIFSIELVSFLSFFYYENKKTKMFYFLVIISIIPMIVMGSRSSYVMLFVVICYNLIYHKKTLKILLSSFVFAFAVVLTGKLDDILSIVTLKEHSYTARLGSITQLIDNLGNDNFITILFGKGVGFANMELEPGMGFGVYVENFHLALLYDSGIFIFLFWILFNLTLILFTIFKKRYFELAIIIFGILLVNIFSSNLTGYTVEIIYWLLVFKQMDNLRITSYSKRNDFQYKPL
ncbi:hypothetical protein [uncultured Tenacibaculum sp.]|uniref:hypothetical protein n=1 Tax=uncultured Tenacibaculum sp. TaxID=174713 RepID=UPI002622713F|nr:hypothetical protein [uncultured Tenacibaculum sp.]